MTKKPVVKVATYRATKARAATKSIAKAQEVARNLHLRIQLDEIKIAPVTAPMILMKAHGHITDRAATYDKPEGERSMGSTIAAFNIITGNALTESDGWLIMQILKDVRDRQTVAPHKDSLEDAVAYAALKAESRLAGR
jgi:hypothetical protein